MTNKHAIHKQFTTHYSLLTNFAFTLAETLIVMGIIGVVAALTLPNLNSSTGDKEKVAKLKKIYSNLNDAYGRMEAIYGPVCSWLPGTSTSSSDSKSRNKVVGERMSDFLKVSKNCEFSLGCATNTSNWKMGQSTDNYKLILADGSSLFFHMWRQDCNGIGDKANFANIYVDIDGPNKGANEEGKDVFSFSLTTDGIYPTGGQQDPTYGTTDELLKTYCFKGDYRRRNCTGWVIENGNMDYLKANTTGVCNGIQLSWSNTSCK
ncbi:type II secretion system protein [bacterium]|nr:type II secretion system protein [bacterium]